VRTLSVSSPYRNDSSSLESLISLPTARTRNANSPSSFSYSLVGACDDILKKAKQHLNLSEEDVCYLFAVIPPDSQLYCIAGGRSFRSTGITSESILYVLDDADSPDFFLSPMMRAWQHPFERHECKSWIGAITVARQRVSHMHLLHCRAQTPTQTISFAFIPLKGDAVI
jgi:hypothetical protein